MSLNNFGLVTPNLFRCAQPDKKGAEDLKILGVTTVFKLNSNEEFPDLDELRNFGAGVEIIRISISIIDPVKSDIIRDTHTLNEFIKEETKSVAHCMYGRDRTGFLIAAWRILHCGWSFDKADEERRLFGDWFNLEVVDHMIVNCLKSLIPKFRLDL